MQMFHFAIFYIKKLRVDCPFFYSEFLLVKQMSLFRCSLFLIFFLKYVYTPHPQTPTPQRKTLEHLHPGAQSGHCPLCFLVTRIATLWFEIKGRYDQANHSFVSCYIDVSLGYFEFLFVVHVLHNGSFVSEPRVPRKQPLYPLWVRGKVCLHYTLPRPQQWEFSGLLLLLLF